MPNALRPKDNYQNFGGINTKASPYITGPFEFLDIKNFDFEMPGSLTKRWGTTAYIGTTFTGQITTLYQYDQTNGYSALIFSTGSTLFSHYGTGATKISLPLGVGATQDLDLSIYGFVTTGINASTNRFSSGFSVYAGLTTFFYDPLTFGTGYKDEITLNNVVVICDKSSVFKLKDNTLTKYQIPEGGFFGTPGSSQPLSDVFLNTNLDVLPFVAPLTGNYTWGFAYRNNLGSIGPIHIFAEFVSNASFVSSGGTTYSSFNPSFRFGVPLGYGISSCLSFFRSGRIKDGGLYWYGNEAAVDAGGTFCDLQMMRFTKPDGKFGGQTFPPVSEQIYDLADNPILLSSQGMSGSVGNDINQFPSNVEIFNNSVMLSGFSTLPSTLYYTEIDEIEKMLPENFVEVRTNDGDKITGQRTYNNRLYIFKQDSFHVFSGDDPSNYVLRQVSDEYGCVNNRCIILFNNIMMFLDKKGVMKFDGANYEIISTKIQGIFERMNLSAAYNVACMVHDKPKNQILCGIPVDGATLNNLTVVYDYNVGSFTTYNGFVPSIFSLSKGNFGIERVFYGSFSGMVSSFGPSFFSDNGTGFTVYFKTRFLHEMGESIEKQWRRLFLNVDPVVGVTSTLSIDFYKNFGSSIVYSKTMYQTPFQSRIDFGIPGKSLAFALSNSSATDSVRVHGFVLEYRYQRAE